MRQALVENSFDITEIAAERKQNRIIAYIHSKILPNQYAGTRPKQKKVHTFTKEKAG